VAHLGNSEDSGLPSSLSGAPTEGSALERGLTVLGGGTVSESNLNGNGRIRPLRLVLVLNVSLAAETQDALLSALTARAGPPVPAVAAPAAQVGQSEDPWLSLDRAAQHVGISTSTLYKYVSQGKIQSRKLAGRLQFRRSALDSFMEEHVRPVRHTTRSRNIMSAALGSGK
jgi:excisionase family DNA binding protein